MNRAPVAYLKEWFFMNDVEQNRAGVRLMLAEVRRRGGDPAALGARSLERWVEWMGTEELEFEGFPVIIAPLMPHDGIYAITRELYDRAKRRAELLGPHPSPN